MINHSITVQGKNVSVKLEGKLYVHDAGVVREALMEKLAQGAAHIHIDLTNITYIDSSGLGVLVTIHKRTKELNGELTLSGVHGLVGELFKRTRLDKVLVIQRP